MLSTETGHSQPPMMLPPGNPLGSTVLCETKCTALSLRGQTERIVN